MSGIKHKTCFSPSEHRLPIINENDDITHSPVQLPIDVIKNQKF